MLLIAFITLIYKVHLDTTQCCNYILTFMSRTVCVGTTINDFICSGGGFPPIRDVKYQTKLKTKHTLAGLVKARTIMIYNKKAICN